MPLLVTGTIGIDTVETPTASAEGVSGGSCAYFAAAAAFHHNPIRIVGAVGGDWPAEHKSILESIASLRRHQREAERKYKESKDKDGVFNMTCDKVDAKVRVKEDGSWEILEILGRHEQAYERKKVYE